MRRNGRARRLAGDVLAAIVRSLQAACVVVSQISFERYAGRQSHKDGRAGVAGRL